MKLDLVRRRILQGAAGLVATIASPGRSIAAGTSSLKEIAAQRGILYGSEAVYEEIAKDENYAALFLEQCAIMTPGIEAKWADIEPDDGVFNFDHLDWLVDFARKHGIAVRGHNLMWAVYNPLWAEVAVKLEGRGAEILKRHIVTEVARYRHRIGYWDVCNELTDPLYNPLEDGLIDSMWRRHVGPMVVDDAFKWAAEADPDAILFVNDDGLEYDDAQREEKRNTYLRLVEAWLKRGVPIKGFGLESHLRPPRRLDAKRYRRFLAELAGMGLVLHITELDVQDRDLPADLGRRDRLVGR
jgi:endo-1,4-beta-xylanase